jgi:biopolymer transport protein ExbD
MNAGRLAYVADVAQTNKAVRRLQYAPIREPHELGVVLVVLLVFLTAPTWHHTNAVDVPKVLHPVSIIGAAREDAMKVTTTRDGKVYFGVEQARSSNLSQKISDRVKDPEVEWKVYIVADMRARWGSIKPVLDGVHAAGIRRIAFLVDQRRSAAFRM